MTDLQVAQEWIQKLRDWLSTFEGMPQAQDFYIDYNREDAINAGLHSNGLVPVDDMEDVIGNIIMSYQLNFALHVVFDKPPEHDEQSTNNAAWVLAFQRWVIRQSRLRKCPTFGNIDQYDEVLRAQNGGLYINPEDGAGLYAVTISVQFKELIKEDE